jgi:FixJ family two-component response regulator
MIQKRTVAIIDDEESVRKSLVRMLQAKGFQAWAFSSAREFVDSPQSTSVSCVVSDLLMPEVDGRGLQRMLGTLMPHLSIVFLTGHGDVTASVTAMKAGAVDFLEKPVNCDALVEAIHQASERTLKSRVASAKIDALNSRYAILTPREREVFSLVTAGLLNKQVAAELGVAEKTVKQHRGQVMSKMAAQSLADLVLMAEWLGVRPREIDFARARGKLTT